MYTHENRGGHCTGIRAVTTDAMTHSVSNNRYACVFAGPSLSGYTPPPGIEVRPPATRGALSDAVRSGHTGIGFIDGAVEGDERLPLQELRSALAIPGVMVFGAASMGAVRAVQLQSEGMHGVGRVFRLLRRGRLTGRDEVYVLHAPAALQYRCLTIPLVNIRYTIRAMYLAGRFSSAEQQALVTYMRDVPWFERDRHALSAAIYAVCGSSRRNHILQTFDHMYRDVKQEDACSLLMRLQHQLAPKEISRNVAADASAITHRRQSRWQ